MATTILQASTRELLHELVRRIGSPQPSDLTAYIAEYCDIDAEATMPFSEFYHETRHLGLSKIKLSQALVAIPGVATYSGTANVRMVRGLRWR